MVTSFIRWAYILLILLAVGPLAGWAVRSLHDAQGGHDCSLLLSDAPIRGLLIGLAISAAALVVGALASRLFSLGTGLACAGFLFAWASWQLGTVEGIIRTSGGQANLLVIALEAALLSVAAILIGIVCTRAAASAQPAADPAPKGVAGLFAKSMPEGSTLMPIVAAVAVGAISGGLAAAILAVNGLKGQSLCAAILGGLVCGLISSHAATASKITLHPAAPMLGMMLVAIIAPVATSIMQGKQLMELMYADQLVTLARPLSLDWIAGMLLGVPTGMAWAGVVLDVRSIEQPESAT